MTPSIFHTSKVKVARFFYKEQGKVTPSNIHKWKIKVAEFFTKSKYESVDSKYFKSSAVS